MAENVIPFNDKLERRVKQSEAGRASAGNGGGSEPPDMSDVSDRIHRLEGAYDALKVVRPMTIAVVAILLTAAIGAVAFLGVQVTRVDGQITRLDAKIDTSATLLDGKIDALPQRLANEFQAMRIEMAAQTTAISSAVTASKQIPPQVLLVPVQPQQQDLQKR